MQLGTPLYVLKELGGWETLATVNRYVHLAPEHLKAHAWIAAISQYQLFIQTQRVQASSVGNGWAEMIG